MKIKTLNGYAKDALEKHQAELIKELAKLAKARKRMDIKRGQLLSAIQSIEDILRGPSAIHPELFKRENLT